VGERVEYRIAPITGRAALKWIAETHRHLPKLQGALFAVSVKRGDELVGVATAGNPARVWQGTGRFVITRCAALPGLPPVVGKNGDEYPAPVCSMLLKAICRAGRELGYSEAWTYTLPDEGGASLRAAGFEYQGETAGGEHSRISRPRNPAVRPEPKGRWVNYLRRERLAA